MESKDKKNKGDFFQLTRHQVEQGVNKYNNAASASSVFKSLSIDESKLKEKSPVFQKRLNSTDSAILEEIAYITLDDADLKLEKRIENCEQFLLEINEKLTVAEIIKDVKEEKELLRQKNILSKNLENLKVQYKTQNLDTKLTNILAKILNFPQSVKKEIKKQFKLLFKRSKFIRQITPLARSLSVRETLSRLNKINKSVDQLVMMKVPFGEQEERYQTLVNHLARATALHSQIQKELLG